MTDNRATAWSLTINNPTSADEEDIALARQRGWKVEGQKELGAEGTPHYQLLVRTPQVRFSAVKKAFPRAHIEVARNVRALQAYVHKEETRDSDLPSSQEKYPSLSVFWGLLYDEFRADSVLNVDGTKQHCDWAPHVTNPLDEYEYAVDRLIRRGYHVETLAVNPQNISAFKKYAIPLMVRHLRATLPTQTDRQTDEKPFTDKLSDSAYPNATLSPSCSLEAHLPTFPPPPPPPPPSSSLC